jgi:hypothetical protein
MKCFSVSYLLTTFAGIGAALNGVVAAPAEPPRAGLALTAIGNSPLPPALEQAMWRNYKNCKELVARNPRIFDGQPPGAADGICIGDAGLTTGFQQALTVPPADLLMVRASMHNLAASRSENLLSAEINAGYTLKQLMRMNLRDYRESSSSSCLADQRTLVTLLKEHIDPDQRTSMAIAGPAYARCKALVQGPLDRLARKEVAERTTLAIARSIGDPGTMSLEQLDDVRDELMQQQFGNSAIKRRKVNDALRVLVDEHRQAIA